MQPVVTIGMPVFNCEKTLADAIQSILNQTYSHWELILIDDGSTDKTLEIAKSFQDSRIKVIADGLNLKLPSRLNQAIAISRGKYFARMDGDDIAYPKRLQTQIEFLENHPQVDLVGTQAIIFNKNGQARGRTVCKHFHSEICSNFLSGNSPLVHPTWIGKSEWFRAHQYKAQAIRMEDYDILLRSHKNSCFACLPDVLLGYRVENVPLKKILPARYYLSKACLEKSFVDREYVFVLGILVQAVKLLVDIFAISTNLKFKILSSRMGIPLSEAELVQWKEIWASCTTTA